MRPEGKLARVARKLRVEYAGAIYHVINRSEHREPIYQDDDDRRAFLETLAQACAKTAWQVHACCLMGKRIGAHHGGGERIESAKAKAERVLAEEIARRRWSGAELEQRRKGEAEKIAIARRLRTERTMT